jgi:hypothetical protein
MMTMTSKRDEFFKLIKRPLKTKKVTVEGQEFTIRELSEADSAEMEIKLQGKDNKVDWTQHRRLLVSYCLVDDDGKRIVENPDDLKDAPMDLIGSIYKECMSISEIAEEDVEKLAKKSEEVES